MLVGFMAHQTLLDYLTPKSIFFFLQALIDFQIMIIISKKIKAKSNYIQYK